MARAQKFIKVGLGEALRRLLDLEIRMRHGVSTDESVTERDLILSALNKVELSRVRLRRRRSPRVHRVVQGDVRDFLLQARRPTRSHPSRETG